MKRAVSVSLHLILLTGCVSSEPPSPAQKIVNDKEFLSVTIEECAVVVGVEGAMRIQDTEARLEAKARAAGATDADFQRANTKIRTLFALSSGMKGLPMTCGDFMSSSSKIILQNS